jgi:chaperonin GroES
MEVHRAPRGGDFRPPISQNQHKLSFFTHFGGSSIMKMKPLADRVIIKPSPAEEKTRGGIILPDTAKEKPVIGEVVAVGPGKRSDDGKLVAMDVKAGDKVLYGKYSGTEVTVDGQEYLIMRESDLFAIV